MESQNNHDEVLEEKSAETDFQTYVSDPIEEDTYYYSENGSVVAKCLYELNQMGSDTLGSYN